MSITQCPTCGFLALAETPEACPVCATPGKNFTDASSVFEESAEQSSEAAAKHEPDVTVNADCGLIPDVGCVDVIVRIGATKHPMENAHYIQFIDCYVDSVYVSRVFLSPGVYAAGCFHLKPGGKKVTIVERCNKHGYWKTETSLP